MDLLQELSEAYRISCQEKGLFWQGSFDDYLEIVSKKPWVTENAFQKIYRMIESYGKDEIEIGKGEKVVKYRFFDDPISGGVDAIFGLDRYLMELVIAMKSAALGYGHQKRIFLLHGPVGSSKSTIGRLIRKGLEKFTATPEGAVYALSWKKEALGANLAKLKDEDYVLCPLHEDPLHLIPVESRERFVAGIMEGMDSKIRNDFERDIIIEGDLCPYCRDLFQRLIRKHDGNFAELIRDNVKVRRLVFSEQDRIGIGTFQPKDEKDQDATELTGDINYRIVTILGSDSDPRAFNFDGEFEVGNRGVVEFIEMLKLDTAFLYDLLGVAQEHRVKPKKIAGMDIDVVIIGHTNEPELSKLQDNEFMEALRDRTTKIRVPYVTKVSEETRIYEKYFKSRSRVVGKHIAPHTFYIAALWAVLTRLEDPKLANLDRLGKLKLYDGKHLEGFTSETSKELKESASSREGMFGVSPRYIHDKVSTVLARLSEECVNPFMVMEELESGLENSALIIDKKMREECRQLIGVARQEFAEIAQNEVREAISASPEALGALFDNYINSLKAFTQKGKVINPYTGKKEPPDEQLMRSVEKEIGISDSKKEDFRREIMNFIGARAIEDKKFDYKTNDRLLKALKAKLFKDQKDFINLGQFVSGTLDDEAQKKIDIVKERLIKTYGYCKHCAADTLSYVASIWHRGNVKE